jgi:hypothetical protein
MSLRLLLITISLALFAILATSATPKVLAGDNGGSSLNFDGTNDYVQVPNSSSLLMGSNDFTLEAWIKSSSTSEQRIVSKFIYNGPGYQLSFNDGFGNVQARTSSSSVTAVATTNIADGNWHHVAGVKNGSTLTIYVNGTAENSIGGSTGSTDGSNPLYIGAFTGISNYFNGSIDEVRVWNDARTADEIRAHMFTSFSAAEIATETNLVGYWKLNEGANQLTADETVNGNDGFLGSNSSIDSADPTWEALSTAPIGDETVGGQTDIAGFWASNTSAESGGLTISNGVPVFLQDIGDDIIFSHNNLIGKTTVDLPTTGIWNGAPDPERWNRTWYCDLNDQNANSGTVDLTFDFTTAGMGADPAPSGPASNYRLLERTGTSGPFTDLGGATSVNTGSRTVTFIGMSVNSLCSYITLGTLDDTSSPTAITLHSLTGYTSANISNVLSLVLISVVTICLALFWRTRRS